MPATSLSGASDAELIDIAVQVFTVMIANPTAYASTPALVNKLEVARGDFALDVTEHVAAQAAAKTATSKKQTTREELEGEIRLLRNIAKAAGTSQTLMTALGIPVPNNNAPSTATVPVGQIDTSQRFRHTISWTDSAAPGNRRKPLGVMGAEIWLKLDGPPPVDETQCTFLTLDSKTPYLAEYPGADAGKMAHYMLRWRLTDGSTTAWGETISATITG